MPKVKVAALSYLNTWPFLYGIEQSDIRDQMDLVRTTSAEAARLFGEKEVDVALVPVAAFSELNHGRMVTDYCIGTEGEVYSVALFSQQPVDQLEEILLDSQSRTSVQLLKILMKFFWNQQVRYQEGANDYESSIRESTGGLIIGDRAIRWHGRYDYCYDLGEAWHQLSKLPFVFATWVSRQEVADEFLEGLNQALSTGVQDLEKVKEQINPDEYPDIPGGFDLINYWQHHISYQLDTDKKKGLQRFLNYSPYI